VLDILLVDGYNVINAWPELVALKDNLEHARDKLVDILASYSAYKDYKVIVVFDAHAVTGGHSSIIAVSGRLQAVFTKEGETADSYIEKAAYQLVRAGRGVYVVTSDWAEQLTVLGAGAWRIPARELRSEVLEMDKRIAEGFGGSVPSKRRHELQNRLGQDVVRRLDEMRKGREPQE
jgi:predicted RNA-binding protein with PIN domain